MELHAKNPQSWIETVWDALHGFREDCISTDDEQWDDICTAMAWITESMSGDDWCQACEDGTCPELSPTEEDET